MNFVARKGDTLTLEDERKYLVIDTLEFENDAYLFLITSPEIYLQDINTKLNYRFAKEVVNTESENYGIEIIKDKNLVLKLYLKLKENENINK